MDYHAGVEVSLELSSVYILDASGQIIGEARSPASLRHLPPFSPA
jgi:hypothetical protein